MYECNTVCLNKAMFTVAHLGGFPGSMNVLLKVVTDVAQLVFFSLNLLSCCLSMWPAYSYVGTLILSVAACPMSFLIQSQHSVHMYRCTCNLKAAGLILCFELFF